MVSDSIAKNPLIIFSDISNHKYQKYQSKQLNRNQNTKEIRKDLVRKKRKYFFVVCKDKCNMISKSLKESDER